MQARFPERIDHEIYTDQGRILEGELPGERFKRLSSAVEEIVGPIGYKLSFSKDRMGNRILQGELKAHLTLECQRCLGPLDFPLEAEMNLVLVASDYEAEKSGGIYEPYLVAEDELLDLSVVIEDELLLCLPQFPMHDEGQCHVQTDFPAEESVDDTQETDTAEDNPFSVLADLKRNK